MTFSIVARDPATGAVGVAVASRFFAAGAIVPHVGATCAVASQAWVNPLWGTEGLRRLQTGEGPQAVLADFVRRDAGARARQCHMVDESGDIAAHTGEDCIDWAGHEIGHGFSCAGNMLAGPEVVAAMAESFRASDGEALEERLLDALAAGEAAGGDKRGRQAAGLVIHRGQGHAWLDIRVDDHADPLVELRRLLDVAGERYLMIVDYLPTRERFSGTPDRAELDAAIAAAEEERRASGRPSSSHAIGP